MRVDFYQLESTTAEGALPPLARATLALGERMLVVSADEGQRARIGAGLWELPDSFLANGAAGGPHDARQPVLLSAEVEPANGARYLALADGLWRDAAEGFERVFLLFDQTSVEAARTTWRMLDGRDGLERNFWRQEAGKWVKAA